MNAKVIVSLTIAGVCSVALARTDSRDELQNTAWILGPFGVEHQLASSSHPSTIGVYIAGVVKNANSGTELAIGPAVEYMFYSADNFAGLGYGLRAILADGLSICPSVAYVTRPKQGVCFRVGLNLPLGGNAVGVYPEIGIGFRF